ncbi:Phosphopantothenate--cysteine ligase cab2, partial [Spiromyces aspiralis]
MARQAEHKIQSRGGNLTLEMNQVPKFLKPLVTNWAPEGYIVSFKASRCECRVRRSSQLETDHRLLESKARHALASYGHQIVIANMLQTRKHEVWLIEDGQPAQHIELGHDARDKADIEQHIVEELAKRHA